MINLMLDTETLGVGGPCVILSCAVVPFDLDGTKIYDDQIFYDRINPQHSINEGFKQRQATLDFWNRQPVAIRKREFGGTKTIREFCQSLEDYLNSVRKRWKTYQVWCTASKLDFGGLYNLYDHVGMSYPIPYTAERDARTIRALTKGVCDKHDFAVVDHHPVEDCKVQIRELQEQYTHISIS